METKKFDFTDRPSICFGAEVVNELFTSVKKKFKCK